MKVFLLVFFFGVMSLFLKPLSVFGACGGDNVCGGSGPSYECCNAGQCGGGSNKCVNHCCVPPPPVEVDPCSCGGVPGNCNVCPPSQPPTGGCSNGLCGANCNQSCLAPAACPPCACNGNCQNGVCTSGCGGAGLWKQYLWVHRSSGEIASNNASCSNFWGDFGFSVTGLTCLGDCAGATTLATLTCQQNACGGMRCDVVSAAGRTYRMTARITAPSGFSLGRADWWTESQSGSGGTATFNVSDGSNFNFVPYFDFNRIPTRTTLQISDNPDPNSPRWTSGTLNPLPGSNCGNGYCVYMRTRVVRNSDGAYINPIDTDNRIDVSKNGAAMYTNIDDSDIVYQKNYTSNTSWPNGTYRFRSSYSGTSYWAPSVSGIVRLIVNKPVCVPPGKPNLTSPADGFAYATMPTSVDLSWQAVAGATSYDVYVNGSLVAPDFTGTTFSYTGLNVATTYQWYVVAKNGAACPGPASDQRSFSTPSSCNSGYSISPIVVNISGTLTNQMAIEADSGISPIPNTGLFDTSKNDLAINGLTPGNYIVRPKFLPAGCSSSPPSSNVSIFANTCSVSPEVFDITCVNPGDFFQVFGGGAVAGDGKIENSNLSLLDDDNEDRFISLDSPGSFQSMAGVLTANGEITPANMYSGQPEGTSGWNLIPYSVNKSAMERQSDYDSLKEIVWKNAGASPEEVCEDGEFGEYAFKCFNSAEDPGQKFEVLDPEFLVIAPTNSGDVSINSQISFNPGKKVIVFVDGKLTVGENVSVGNPAGVVFVVNGDLEVAQNVTQLDGVYVFSGKFSDGGGNNVLSGKGILIGRGGNGDFSNNGLMRDDGTNSNLAMEKFYYQGKYLDFFKNALARPKVSWSELAPK